MNYNSSGIDTEQADDSVRRMLKHLKHTYNNRVMISTGYFANAVEIGGGYSIAMCTDGVGSKIIIADMMKKYDTIGIDCVAMNVNDLICIGATPIGFLDYIAVSKIDPSVLESIGIGLAEGSRQSGGVPIVGGEISQLPDTIIGFDLVGSAVGIIDTAFINTGKHVSIGDVIIGIESSGLHSNGYSLVRKILFPKFNIYDHIDSLDCVLGEKLIKPTHIYVPEILEMCRYGGIARAMINITGDGLLNLNRIEADVSLCITNLPSPPAIFDFIQYHGGVSDADMYNTFNMGVGFCLIVHPSKVNEAMDILEDHHREAWIIGEVIEGHKSIHLLEKRLLSYDGEKFSNII
jgi:phosphoribosylformylglycinamidine cyclo-ligase